MGSVTGSTARSEVSVAKSESNLRVLLDSKPMNDLPSARSPTGSVHSRVQTYKKQPELGEKINTPQADEPLVVLSE